MAVYVVHGRVYADSRGRVETKGNGIKIAGITASAFLEQFFTGIVRPPNGNSRPSYADASKLSRDSSNKSRDREKSSVSESGEGIGKISI